MKNLLTDREKEILLYCSKGLNNKMIANLLSISNHTVKSHLESIALKLHTHNKIQAIIFAIQNGIISLNDI